MQIDIVKVDKTVTKICKITIEVFTFSNNKVHVAADVPNSITVKNLNNLKCKCYIHLVGRINIEPTRNYRERKVKDFHLNGKKWGYADMNTERMTR